MRKTLACSVIIASILVLVICGKAVKAVAELPPFPTGVTIAADLPPYPTVVDSSTTTA